ncbi:MAG: co-chaperone GroES [Myxococcales bacterium]|nr:co-chaperone GroES [Myxococcales bacterium]MCB9645402.1 co-chaperone GroES [Deltaproteobacteria bacterium]
MNLQPVNGYVLIEPVEAEQQTRGGIYVPDSAQQRPAEGYVRAMSADAGDEVAIGDRVVYKKFSGEDLTLDGNKVKLIPYGDLLGKFVEADAIPE